MNNLGSTIIFIGCIVLAFVLGGKYYPVERAEDILVIHQDFEYRLEQPIPGTFVGKKPGPSQPDTIRINDTTIIHIPVPTEDYDVEFLDKNGSDSFYARVHVMPANLDARLDSLHIKQLREADTLKIEPVKIVEYEISDFQRIKWAAIGGLLVYIILRLGS